jgi:hypothetical protein
MLHKSGDIICHTDIVQLVSSFRSNPLKLGSKNACVSCLALSVIKLKKITLSLSRIVIGLSCLLSSMLMAQYIHPTYLVCSYP